MLRAYDPLSGKCRGVEMPTKLLGRIGLCSSNVDPRFCGLDVDTSDMSGDRGEGDGVRRGAFSLLEIDDLAREDSQGEVAIVEASVQKKLVSNTKLFSVELVFAFRSWIIDFVASSS
jgi:hypothetical protein